MRKIKLIVSDFHLGRGKYHQDGSLNLLEDFVWDHKWRELLEYYSTGEFEDSECELIFNGDMLNLILTDYHGHFPVVLTERISSEKLHAIIEGHPIFFDSLRRFIDRPGCSLTYVIGNHDQEMMWESTKAIFENAVGQPVSFKNTYYQVDGIHIEHGHQYEAANRIDPARPFLTESLPEPILNLPWGTLFAVQFLIKLKKQRPAVDKVRPIKMFVWWSFFHDTWFAISNGFRLLAYFFSTRFSKSRYRYSSLSTTMKILWEAPIFPDLTEAAKRVLRTPEIHTVVFGHTHVYKQTQIAEGKQYINLGTWNEILSLDLASYGRRTKLTYTLVDVDSEGGRPSCRLRHWIGKIPLEDDALGTVL